MDEDMSKVFDGHRHRYDRSADVSAWRRTCIHCGFTEDEIHRLKKNLGRVHTSLDAVIAEAQAQIQRDGTGLNSFGLIFEAADGYHTAYFPGQPCYANLGGYAKSKVGALVMVDRGGYLGNLRDGLTHSWFMAYVDYAFRRSPYAPVYMNTQQNYYEHGFTAVLNGKYPAQMVVGAAMQLRYLGEKPSMVQTWFRLSQAGMDERIAWVLSHWYSANQHGTLFRAPGLMGHTILDTTFGKDHLKNFLENKYDTTLTPFKRNTSYRGLVKPWGKGTGNHLFFPSVQQVHRDAFGRPVSLGSIRLKDKKAFGKFIEEFGQRNGV